VPQVLEDLGGTAEGAQIQWHGADVVADPAQLRVLLQNLVGNACAYRASDRPCRISVTARSVQGRTVLQVVDNGPGIPTAARGAAMAPLSRLRADVPGTGLGLVTCVRIAAAHGGSYASTTLPAAAWRSAWSCRADSGLSGWCRR